MISLRPVLVLTLLLPLLGACDQQRYETVLTGHPVHTRQVAKLSVGKSSQNQVEEAVGVPDEIGPDGSMVYRATAVRRTVRGGGTTSADAAEVVGQRTTTFRFENGVLTKICRTRS